MEVYKIICNGEDLFWSNEMGWVDLESSDSFTEEETKTLNLPINGSWCHLDSVELMLDRVDEIISKYEQASGNVVDPDGNVIDSNGKFVGEFSLETCLRTLSGLGDKLSPKP